MHEEVGETQVSVQGRWRGGVVEISAWGAKANSVKREEKSHYYRIIISQIRRNYYAEMLAPPL